MGVMKQKEISEVVDSVILESDLEKNVVVDEKQHLANKKKAEKIEKLKKQRDHVYKTSIAVGISQAIAKELGINTSALSKIESIHMAMTNAINLKIGELI